MYKRFDPKIEMPILKYRENGAMLSEWLLGYYADKRAFVAVRYWKSGDEDGWEYTDHNFGTIEDIDAPDYYNVGEEETTIAIEDKESVDESEHKPPRRRRS